MFPPTSITKTGPKSNSLMRLFDFASVKNMVSSGIINQKVLWNGVKMSYPFSKKSPVKKYQKT